MSSKSVSVPVIVVGNITVGGTGKTPLVIWMAEFLANKEFKVGIINRGYGGSSPNWPVDVTVHEKAEVVGDEAVMLRQRSGVAVVASPDRVEAAKMLIANHRVNIIISDDGLQHLALSRELDIVVLDAKQKFGNHRLLPSGPLREPISTIPTGALVVYSSNEFLDQHQYTVQLVPVRFINVTVRGITLDVNHFKDQRVNAVAGIGIPEKFFSTLESLGIRISRHDFADHYNFKQRDLNFDNNFPIIMTHKDAVKCADLVTKNAWYLEITAQPNDEFIEHFNQALRLIKTRS